MLEALRRPFSSRRVFKPERMSQDARDFAFDLLLENQRALCAETTIS